MVVVVVMMMMIKIICSQSSDKIMVIIKCINPDIFDKKATIIRWIKLKIKNQDEHWLARFNGMSTCQWFRELHLL